MKKKKTINQELKNERNSKIKQFLIDMIAPVLLLAITIGLFVYGEHVEHEDDKFELPEMYEYDGVKEDLKLTSGDYVFTLNTETTYFTVENTVTGAKWESNPSQILNIPGMDIEAQKFVKSTLVLDYSDEAGNDYPLYYNSTYSIELDKHSAELAGDCIRVNYSIGDLDKVYLYPPVLTEEEYEEYKKKIDMFDWMDVELTYQLLDPADAALLAQYGDRYPELKEGKKIYIVSDDVGKTSRLLLEAAFKGVPYTREQYDIDSQRVVSENKNDKPVFNVTMEYRLDGNKLTVSVPFDNIYSTSKNPLRSISILPFFGAGSSTEEGFLFVPEGSGSLIKFNNGKTSMEAYASRFYGRDLCLTKEALVHDPISAFNVFGISKNNVKDGANTQSFICIPDEGESYGTLYADVYRPKSPANNTYVKYDLFVSELFDMGSGGTVSANLYKYIDELPKGEKIQQTYYFLDTTGNDISDSYCGMALEYRKYLTNKYGSYLNENTDTSTPVNIEIVGAVDKTEQVLGIPVSRPLELTSFEEAGELAKDLHDDVGMKNVNLKYVGWCNGGVSQTVFSSVSPLGKLGGKSDLKDLSENVKNLGYNLSLNGICMYAIDSNIFDGFFSFGDAAKNISQERMEIFKYSAVTYILREGTEPYYLVHTPLSMKYADRLVEACDKYGTGVSFDEIGKDLASDYYDDDYHSRENVKGLHTELLKKTKDSGKYIVINEGNAYALPYVDMITNMNLKGSDYSILDENIPFLELAIHGYVNYTGDSLNISGDINDELLYSAAFGAGLSFTFMKESPFTLQDTLYTHYYGCDYDAWKSYMVDIYKKYESNLGHIFNKKMDKFEYITEDNKVSCTTYSDGTKVYVNFGFNPYEKDGISIPARDYIVKR